ncbi:MAG TPA: YkgJ family cysteine cluster protein [Kofleriaceae bacterium]|nr:YkgJ family cysteine cluster protein [Kofleriaceae bacterium]
MSRLGELTAKVDGFFARVSARHGTDMQCQTGCSDCCHVRLTVTAVEAAAIRAYAAGLPHSVRAQLVSPSDTASDNRGPRCAALDVSGRCTIYDARPLVCRSHGVPIRLRSASLPVVQACHRNFRHTAPDGDCVLDQATLSATLLAINAAENPSHVSERVELAALLAELAAI